MKTSNTMHGSLKNEPNMNTSFRVSQIKSKRLVVSGALLESRRGQIGLNSIPPSLEILVAQRGVFSFFIIDQLGRNIGGAKEFVFEPGVNILQIANFAKKPGLYFLTISDNESLRLLQAKFFISYDDDCENLTNPCIKEDAHF